MPWLSLPFGKQDCNTSYSQLQIRKIDWETQSYIKELCSDLSFIVEFLETFGLNTIDTSNFSSSWVHFSLVYE